MVRPGRPAVTAAAAVSVDGSSAPAVRAVPVASGVSVVAVVTAVTGWMPPGRALTAVMPGMAVTAAGAVRVAGCSVGAVPVVPVVSGVSVVVAVSAGTVRMPRTPALMGRTPEMVGTAVPAGVVVRSG
jgi:hypothetical protein